MIQIRTFTPDIRTSLPDIRTSMPEIRTSLPDFSPNSPALAESAAYIHQQLEQAESEEDPWKDLSNRQKAFLLKWVEKGSMLIACPGVCPPASHFLWSRTSKAYARAAKEVLELLKDKLIAFAHRLALFGEKIPLLHEGQPCLSPVDGTQLYETRHSNRLLLLFLKLSNKLLRQTPTRSRPKPNTPPPVQTLVQHKLPLGSRKRSYWAVPI